MLLAGLQINCRLKIRSKPLQNPTLTQKKISQNQTMMTKWSTLCNSRFLNLMPHVDHRFNLQLLTRRFLVRIIQTKSRRLRDKDQSLNQSKFGHPFQFYPLPRKQSLNQITLNWKIHLKSYMTPTSLLITNRKLKSCNLQILFHNQFQSPKFSVLLRNLNF